MEKPISKDITWVYNFALFLYLVLLEIGAYFVDPDVNTTVPLDLLISYAPVRALIFALVFALLLVFVGAMFFRFFWNRLVADVLSLRMLLYRESIAITLMIVILKEI